MALKPPRPTDSGPRELIDAGTYPATLTGIIDLGHQDTTYNNNKPRLAHQIRLQFVVTDDNGAEKIISKKMTLSVHEKAGLRSAMHALTGRKFTDDEAYEFDLGELLGKSCLAEVINEPRRDGDGNYNALGKLVAFPKGIKQPVYGGDVLYYEIEDDIPEGLPEFIAKEIAASREKRGVAIQAGKSAASPEDEDDDTPDPPKRRPPVKSFDELDPNAGGDDEDAEIDRQAARDADPEPARKGKAASRPKPAPEGKPKGRKAVAK